MFPSPLSPIALFYYIELLKIPFQSISLFPFLRQEIPGFSLRSPSSGGVTRRASSVLLQRLRSFSISYPSACFDTPTLLQPADAHAAAQATEEPVTSPTTPSPRVLVLTSQPAPAAAEEEEDPSAMSMEEAYALVLASRRLPEPEREDEEARRSDVDAKENLRQQRLNSIFNYTQMLKQRALDAGRRQPDARRDQL